MRMFFFFVLVAVSGLANAGWFGPKDYDECILEHMKDATLPAAVFAIKNSCRKKFPQDCYRWQKENKKKGLPSSYREIESRITDKYLLTVEYYGMPEGCSEVVP